MFGAYELWINNEPVLKSGKVGTTPETSISESIYKITSISTDENLLEVVIHISNFIIPQGGLLRIIRIGPEVELQNNFFIHYSANFIILGCFLIMGLYHLGMFMFRKKDLSSLYFSVGVLLWAVNIFISALSVFAIMLMFPKMENYIILTRLDCLTYFASVPVLLMFLHFLYKEESYKIVIRIVQISTIVFCLIIIFIHNSLVWNIWYLFMFISIPAFLYGIFILIRASINKKYDANILLIGCFIAFVCAANHYIAEVYGSIFPFLTANTGVFAFVLFQSLTLAYRFSRSFHNVEKLSGELEQKNISLTKLDNLKDEFLANTSHELKTPLHGIIGISESILNKAKSELPENISENISLIASSGHRLSNLVNDILDFSRIKNNELKLNLIPVDISSIVDLVIKLSSIMIGEKSLKINNVLPVNLPMVLADENRIKQIFHNLIGNAIKFTNKGSINISASFLENTEQDSTEIIKVHVADTGIGIPEKNMESIFDSFKQADGTGTRLAGGTGLGLTITKMLVGLHNGEIWVNSKVNKGSTFSFSLPAVDTIVATRDINNIQPEKITVYENCAIANDIHKTSNKKPVVFNWNNSPCILIVDDDPVNIKILQNYLEQKNCKLLTAMNGPQALEMIFENKSIDLVLLDIMMPMMSGYEVCKRIREKYTHEKLPVIMLTAKNQMSDINTGFEAGANDYIVKPFQVQELLARINTMLRLKNINKDLITRIVIIDRGNKYFFNYDEIIYIRIHSKGIIIHTLRGYKEFYALYKEIKDKLPENIFIRIHKQFTINVKYILKIKHTVSGRYKLILNDPDNTKLPIGPSYLDNFRNRINI